MDEKISFARDFIEAVNGMPADSSVMIYACFEAVCCEIAVFFFDTATFWAMFKALGVSLSFSHAFIAFILASAVSTISVVPGGVGFFEGSSIAILSTFGMSVGSASAGVLLFRVLTYWIPMVPGYLIFRSELIGTSRKTKVKLKK